MLFVDLATGKPKTRLQLINENKHMSLPLSWGDATLESLGVKPVSKTPAPDVGEYEIAVKDGVEEVDGVWQEKWLKRDMFVEYTDTDEDGNPVTHTVQAQKDAKIAFDNAALATTERTKRDELLKATDYYGMSDVLMSEAMTTYRQALRDVPQQEGFPTTITWPTKPTE